MRIKRKELDSGLVKKISEHLKYDPDSGQFFWFNPTSCKSKKGWFSGSLFGKKGYLGFRVFWEKYYAHRLAWALSYGECPADMEIDHINGVRNDNRLSNLRLVTTSQNQYNKNMDVRNKSGVKGVHFCRKEGKWRARFSANRKEYFIGFFDDLSAAKTAITNARNSIHGEFANHGRAAI